MALHRISGRIFEQQSSDYSDYELVVDGDRAFVHSGAIKQDIGNLAQLKIQARLGSFAQKITLPDGRVFETEDLDAVEQLRPGGFWNTVAKTEKTGWHLIPLAIATPFMAFGLYKLMIPVLISMGMSITPDQGLYALDQSTLRTLDRIVLDETELTAERQDELTTVFNKLLAAKEKTGSKSDRNFKYKLLFRDAGPIGPNAFAMPGGTIVVTDDLVQEFDEDHIIAAVLAHEIGHVDSEHQLRQVYRALGMWFMITMIAGDAGEILEDALLEGSAVLSLSYSREHEMGADNYSYDLLKAADMRTDGLVGFFDRLQKNYPLPKKGEWAMSHPVADNRIENIIERIIADGGTPPDRNSDTPSDGDDGTKSDEPVKEE